MALGRAPVPAFEFLGLTWPEDERKFRGWNTQAVANALAERWPTFLESLELPVALAVNSEAPERGPSLTGQNAHLCFGYVLGRTASTSRMTVLDWGGGIGQYYPIAATLSPDIEFDYHVVDVSELCRLGRELNPAVTFHDGDSWTSSRYDLVMSSGSLQYVPRWAEVLAKLTSAAGRWLYVTRVPVVRQAPSYVVVQRAAPIYDTELPAWVFSEPQLLGELDALGWFPVREFVLGDRAQVAGAPEQPSYRGWLLTRR
jgi:putative methyltransferase (TIGR04325 family)